MSETDPWKVAKSTIRARIADYSVALLGHSSGSQQAKENAQTAIDVAIDAARAAEAAQHQQEMTQQAAHIANLEHMVREHGQFGDLFQPGGRFHEDAQLEPGSVAVVAGGKWLVARLAAVEAERDRHARHIDRAWIHAIYKRDPKVSDVTAERDRLNAALRQAAQDLETVGNDYPGSSCWQWCAGRAAVARAALTPQESTDGETR